MALKSMVSEGDTVSLTDEENSFYLVIKKGETFTTHKGRISHDDIIGKEFGDAVTTHKGHEYLILRPTLYELIMFGIKRKTQIVYPKDSGYIALKLGLGSGMKVLEAGIGSGAMCIVMANIIRPDGVIYAYEKEERFIKIATENLMMASLQDYVIIKHRDLLEGPDEEDFDTAFIDMREPWECLNILKKVVKKTSPVGFIMPTTNQVTMLLKRLSEEGFFNIEVEEIIHRPYKPVPERLRPVDRISAHTGYLVFARTPSGILK
jgi:tRNA (adenine57-N1/adenine58-N1)-methyltransferase